MPPFDYYEANEHPADGQSLVIHGRQVPTNWEETQDYQLVPARLSMSSRQVPAHRSQLRLESPKLVSSSSSFPSSPQSPLSSDPESPRELPSLGHVSAICHPTSEKDVTLHFSLDVFDDLEGRLEELSRLKRLGHFKEVLEYFDASLKDYLHLPLVAIEYADLLREQGAHQRLRDLCSSGELAMIEPEAGVKVPCAYSTHFELVDLGSKCASEGVSWSLRRLLLGYRRKHFRSWGNIDDVPFDSTQLQIIRLSLLVMRDVSSQADGEILGDLPWPNWDNLYKNLLSSGRLWELRDLFEGMISAFGVKSTWRYLTNEPLESQGSLDVFLDDWSVDGYDSSTTLALLDILEQVSYCVLVSGSLNTSKRFLEKANFYATEIRVNSPELMKTRPYLQWTLTSQKYSRLWLKTGPESQLNYFSRYPGMVVDIETLPIYVPVVSENPGWPPADPNHPPNEILMTALETARELGDYQTQGKVLRELICRVDDPSNLFDQLGHLQGSIQGHQVEYHQTCLSRYLLSMDEESGRRLISKIGQITDKLRPDPVDDVLLLRRWSGLMIKTALCRSCVGFDVESDRAKNMAQDLFKKLQPDIIDAYWNLYFPRQYGNLDTRSTKQQYSFNHGSRAENNPSRLKYMQRDQDIAKQSRRVDRLREQEQKEKEQRRVELQYKPKRSMSEGEKSDESSLDEIPSEFFSTEDPEDGYMANLHTLDQDERMAILEREAKRILEDIHELQDDAHPARERKRSFDRPRKLD